MLEAIHAKPSWEGLWNSSLHTQCCYSDISYPHRLTWRERVDVAPCAGMQNLRGRARVLARRHARVHFNLGGRARSSTSREIFADDTTRDNVLKQIVGKRQHPSSNALHFKHTALRQPKRILFWFRLKLHLVS